MPSRTNQHGHRYGWRWWLLHHGRRVSTTNSSSNLRSPVCSSSICQRGRWICGDETHVRHVSEYVGPAPILQLTLHTDSVMAGPSDPPEYPWLYSIPGILFGGGYIVAASTGMAGLVQAGYLVSSILCISKCRCHL